MPTIEMSLVLSEVLKERVRQEELWGEQNHPDGTGPYVVDGRHRYALGLERWAKRRCDTEHHGGRGTYEMILTEEWAEVIASDDPARLRGELVQLAAVAVGWVEKIDRDLKSAAEAREPLLCPECTNGKVVNCVGVALDFERDEFVPCETAGVES
jgi:hypothetical protein